MSKKIGEYSGISLHRFTHNEELHWQVNQEPGPADRYVQLDSYAAGWLMATLEAELHVDREPRDRQPVMRDEAADLLADELGALQERVRRAAGAESREEGMRPEWWQEAARELLRMASVARRLGGG